MILSCVFFPSRGLKQIVSFVSTPRKSRPPLGEGEEEVDSKVGKNLGWPKSGPSEFVEGKKSSLAGDIATTLPRRIASRYQRSFFSTLLKATVLYALKSLCGWCFYPAIRLYSASAYMLVQSCLVLCLVFLVNLVQCSLVQYNLYGGVW